MKHRAKWLAGFLLVAIAVPQAAWSAEAGTEDDTEWTKKVGSVLLKRMGQGAPRRGPRPGPRPGPTGGARPVIILGQTQLLETPGGFDAFCKANAGRKRSELRDEVIAKLKAIADAEQPTILEAIGNPGNVRRLWIVNAVATTLTPEQIQTVAKLPEVKYIYPDRGRFRPGKGSGKVTQVLKPGKREPFTTEGKKVPWNLEKIGAVACWKELGITGEGVIVASIDAGANYLHSDLKQAVWINENEVPNNGKDDDNNGYVDDYYGFDFGAMSPKVIARGPGPRQQHGTLTAGIAVGDGTGGTVTGVAPRARVMLLKAFQGGHTSTALSFQYALEHGASLASMSFSIPNLGHVRGLWRMMSDHAVCAGLVTISGAGNFQRLPIPVQMRIPEGIPSVICAGGVMPPKMKVPRFCSLGPVEWSKVKFFNDYPMPKGLVKPDVCGFPGPRYPTLGFKNTSYVDPNNRIQGNSFSAPHIAGVVALVFSANPELTAWRVKEILEATATDVGPKGKDPRTGAGLANALAAVKMAIAEKK